MVVHYQISMQCYVSLFQFQRTFIGILVKPPKRIDLIVVAIRHRRIDQACGDISLSLLNARAVIRAAPADGGRTGRHKVGLLAGRRRRNHRFQGSWRPSKAYNEAEVGSGSSRPQWGMVAVPSRWTRMAGGDGKGASGSSHAHGE